MEVGGMEMENSSSSRRMKQVVLNLDENVEKRGGSLVGKLHTSKNLNIPIVISVIKKGVAVKRGYGGA